MRLNNTSPFNISVPHSSEKLHNQRTASSDRKTVGGLTPSRIGRPDPASVQRFEAELNRKQEIFDSKKRHSVQEYSENGERVIVRLFLNKLKEALGLAK